MIIKLNIFNIKIHLLTTPSTIHLEGTYLLRYLEKNLALIKTINKNKSKRQTRISICREDFLD